MASTTSVSLATLTLRATARRPWLASLLTAASFFSAFVPQITTSEPACARASAIPSPIPPLPPVIRATLPVRSNGLYMGFLQRWSDWTVDLAPYCGNLAASLGKGPTCKELKATRAFGISRTDYPKGNGDEAYRYLLSCAYGVSVLGEPAVESGRSRAQPDGQRCVSRGKFTQGRRGRQTERPAVRNSEKWIRKAAAPN